MKKKLFTGLLSASAFLRPKLTYAALFGGNEVEQQIQSIGESVFSIINIVVIIFGGIYLAVIVTKFFKGDEGALKQLGFWTVGAVVFLLLTTLGAEKIINSLGV